MRKHYVRFCSPGTFFNEESSRSIESWDIPIAVRLSKDITERYNSRPFGFTFHTVLAQPPIPDGEGGTLDVREKEVTKSGMHFLGGRVRTLDDVCRDNKEDESILRTNMRNNCPVVVENVNYFKTVQPFGADDVIVDDCGNITHRGSDYNEYRDKTIAEKKLKESQEQE